MTETSSISVLRSTTAMFLFVGLFGIWMGGCEIYQGLKIKRLIRELQDEDSNVRSRHWNYVLWEKKQWMRRLL
jgi:hypothetical protein